MSKKNRERERERGEEKMWPNSISLEFLKPRKREKVNKFCVYVWVCGCTNVCMCGCVGVYICVYVWVWVKGREKKKRAES